MTPARLTRIKHLIDTASSAREMAGLRWGLDQQGEMTPEVYDHMQAAAVRKGWWPLPEYGGATPRADKNPFIARS